MKTSIDAMTQIRDTLVKGDLLCEVVAVGMLDAAIAKQEDAQTVEPVGCLRCNTPKKCAIHGCSPNTWPSENTLTAVTEQSAFEDWLNSTRPSGDSESVQYQWSQSSELADYIGSTTTAPDTEPAKPPENCGTGHCSCIECVVEPAKPSAGEREALIHWLRERSMWDGMLRLGDAADMLAADALEIAEATKLLKESARVIAKGAAIVESQAVTLKNKAQQVATSTLPERDATIPTNQQGLFRKFIVQRTDGSDRPGGKHHGCEYFVLDVTHDQHAPAALRAYAEACTTTHPQLSADLVAKWGAQQVAVPQEPVAKVARVDEYGPQLDWYTHWTNLIGSNLYTSPQPPQAAPRVPMTDEQIDAPEPYDQQALELCEVCGWKTLIPGDCCLNCTRPNPDQEPHGWLIQGSNHLYRGEYAEIDSKSDAQRIGGTCHAYALYTKPQPAAKQVARLIGDCTVEQLPPDGHAMVWARLLICDNVLGAWGDPRWTRFSWWKAMLKGDSPSVSGGWMLDPSCNDKWVQQLDITHWAPMPPDVNQGTAT